MKKPRLKCYCHQGSRCAFCMGLAVTNRYSSLPAVVRFWQKVEKGEGGWACWSWLGGKDRWGYGLFDVIGSRRDRERLGRRTTVAHRFAYETLVGPVPEGLVLDHLCRNTSCVNPEHLEPVTEQENLARSWEVRRGRKSSGMVKHG